MCLEISKVRNATAKFLTEMILYTSQSLFKSRDLTFFNTFSSI